jgi:hypothetical protein
MPKASSSASGSFRPCPEGAIQGILVDVIDIGMVTTTFNGETKESHKVSLVWQMDERRDDNARFTIYQRLTLSLHPKAGLRKIVETLRGRKFTEEEAAEGFELDDLVGSQALLTIVHNAVGDRTYANVAGVSPLPKGMPKLVQEPYERKVQEDAVPF